jgi:hypothetical protein
MGKIRRIIPFGLWPANWGLSGSRRAIAEAEYHWEGEDLDRRLLVINHPDTESKEHRLALVKLDRRYNKIGEFDYEYGLIAHNPAITDTERNAELSKLKHRFGKINAEELDYELLEHAHANKESEAFLKDKLALDIKHKKITEFDRDQTLLDLRFEDHDSKDYLLAALDLQLKHGKITEQQWEKQTATLNKEPWFDYKGGDVQGRKDGQQLAIELDWNEYFPRFLEEQGWSGPTDDAIVDAWFTEAIRQMFLPDLTPEQVEAMEDEDYMPQPQRGTTRRKRDDGRSEYS